MPEREGGRERERERERCHRRPVARNMWPQKAGVHTHTSNIKIQLSLEI